MSRRRRRGGGAGQALLSPPAPAAEHHLTLAPSHAASNGLLPAGPLSAEAVGALTAEMARFSRRLEELLERERLPGRSEDRKETWVVLSALTLVVVFCFVAFYLNQAELRDMHSGLQEDIDRAGHSAASSLERTLAGLHLERLPDAQATVERFLRDKERRDGQRFGDLLSEVQRQGDQGSSRLEESLLAIDDQLAALRQLSEEIHHLQVEVRTLAFPTAGGAVTELALKRPETRAGRTARAADGAPANPPPDPVARPSGLDVSVPRSTAEEEPKR